MMLIGGLSVVAGYKPRAGLGMIAGFLAGVTPAMHRFWEAEDPKQQMSETINFTKNLALLGSVLMLMASHQPRSAHRFRSKYLPPAVL